MSESSLVYELLLQIDEALVRIERRFSRIDSPNAFVTSNEGTDMLDAIGMMLIAIGENLKKIDRETGGRLFERYPEINWQGAKGVRDILSHRYFDLDADEIYDICKSDLPVLRKAIKKMIGEIKNGSSS